MGRLNGQHEIYVPRSVVKLPSWRVSALHLKVYGLILEDHQISEDALAEALEFVNKDVLQKVAQTGDSNDLGFVIIHAGSLGLSVSAHWWTQGSVLCQCFYRRLYDSDAPLDMSLRASIGCVWELAIIDAEREIWMQTMMGQTQDPSAYLLHHAGLETV